MVNGTESEASERIAFGTDLFWIYIGVYVGLALFAGLFAGLTVGLLSLDPLTLKVVSESGATVKQRRRAKRLLPLVERHHLVLVSLVLANAAAVEAMPVFLNAVTNEVVAIVVSVTVVLLVGEILPQALCKKYGLAIGSTLTPLIYFTIFILCPLTFPIAKLLDCLLGKDHHTFYRRQELKTLVALHGPPKERNGRANGQSRPSGRTPPSLGSKTNLLGNLEDGEEGHVDHPSASYLGTGEGASAMSYEGEDDVPLSRDEVMVIEGVLNLKEKTVAAAMVSFDKVFMLSMDSVLDFKTFDTIIKKGYSRIPVYDGTRQNIRKILLVKTLITVNPEDKICLRNLLMRAEFHFTSVAFVSQNRSLRDLLNEFKDSRAGHMSVVYKEANAGLNDDGLSETGLGEITRHDREVVGIVTLEDVIEEMLQVEIYDEFDKMPRMPSIPGYLHYRKVHRVHSHWESGDTGSLVESIEVFHSSAHHYGSVSRGTHRRNTRGTYGRQVSAGHIDTINAAAQAHSPRVFRRKFRAGEASGVRTPEFYLTDADSSSSEFNPGSVNSVGASVEAFASSAGPVVVHDDPDSAIAGPEEDAPVFGSYDSGRKHNSDGQYFRPVMDVLTGMTGHTVDEAEGSSGGGK